MKEYMKPKICICGHMDHGSIIGARWCKKCDCEGFKQNLNKEGMWELVPYLIDAELITSSIWGTFGYKQLTNIHEENQRILKKYEDMPEL